MADHRHVDWDAGTRRIETPRLVLRPWELDDDLAAYAIYGAPEVARWLCPALSPIVDAMEMRHVLAAWIAESDPTGLPLGRWAITDNTSGDVIGALPCFHCRRAARIWKSGGSCPRTLGATVTAPKPVTRLPIRHSKTPVSVRSSQSCDRRTAVVWLPPGEWGWSGSARPTSTTTSRYRSTV